jgi:cytochrome c-type biogenesis protein
MITLLLLTSMLLGLLAFFEPCTIATHTLYSVKLSQSEKKRCWQNLFTIWLSRSLLLIILFTTAVFLTEPPQWSETLPSIILSVMAIIYLISRFIYIPVPHLEFYKLLPYKKDIPHAIKLGLTLPACTLPLVVVVGGMSITLGSIGFAILSGILFSSLFTAPMAITAYKGINKDSLQLLNRAAKGSPYLTAILLFSLALFLLVPTLEINIDEFKQVLTEASWAGIGLAFLAGFVFSFNPVSFASVPVILAYVTKAHEEKRAIFMGAAFIAGMIITHVFLGVAAAVGGEWVQGIMGRQWGLLLGPVLIVMGLMWTGLLNIRFPWFGVKAKKVTGIWGAFLLGIPFSVAVCPFCTPALLITLTASAAIGSISFGFALLLSFALGRSIPVILGAWSMGWLESLNILSRYQKPFEIVAGVVLVMTGLYLLNEYFFII